MSITDFYPGNQSACTVQVETHEDGDLILVFRTDDGRVSIHGLLPETIVRLGEEIADAGRRMLPIARDHPNLGMPTGLSFPDDWIEKGGWARPRPQNGAVDD